MEIGSRSSHRRHAEVASRTDRAVRLQIEPRDSAVGVRADPVPLVQRGRGLRVGAVCPAWAAGRVVQRLQRRAIDSQRLSCASASSANAAQHTPTGSAARTFAGAISMSTWTSPGRRRPSVASRLDLVPQPAGAVRRTGDVLTEAASRRPRHNRAWGTGCRSPLRPRKPQLRGRHGTASPPSPPPITMVH